MKTLALAALFAAAPAAALNASTGARLPKKLASPAFNALSNSADGSIPSEKTYDGLASRQPVSDASFVASPRLPELSAPNTALAESDEGSAFARGFKVGAYVPMKLLESNERDSPNSIATHSSDFTGFKYGPVAAFLGFLLFLPFAPLGLLTGVIGALAD